MPVSNNSLLATFMDSNEKQENGNMSQKREDYLVWDEFFMANAFLAAQRSKDPVNQVGACIVNSERRMVAIGYNGMPMGCSDDLFPWTKNYVDELEDKDLYVCHAEVNAILNRNSSNVRNCIMYIGVFPCNECCKAIIQSGIKEVVYIAERQQDEVTAAASKSMFAAAGVKTRQFTPKNERVVLDYSKLSNVQ